MEDSEPAQPSVGLRHAPESPDTEPPFFANPLHNDTATTDDSASLGLDSDDAHEADPTSFLLLTRRLRCLFSVITVPIVPLGTLVVLALFYLFYAAFFVDNVGLWRIRKSGCSHPLHLFVWVTVILVLYCPNHAFLRGRLFTNHSLRRRRFDQFFQTALLLYVYGGITLVQTCREDFLDNTQNSCQITCPTLTTALTVYVTALECFTLSLILPLLFLPCIYIWFLRSAMADQEALALLQQRLREDEDDTMWLGNALNGRRHRSEVTLAEVLQSLYTVRLIQRDDERVAIVPEDSSIPETFAKEGSRECCICMNQFVLSEPEDIETGRSTPTDPVLARNLIVQAPSCGHLFHRNCLSSWIGGRWDPRNESRRYARRTTCPLCRAELQNNSATRYGTF